MAWKNNQRKGASENRITGLFRPKNPGPTSGALECFIRPAEVQKLLSRMRPDKPFVFRIYLKDGISLYGTEQFAPTAPHGDLYGYTAEQQFQRPPQQQFQQPPQQFQQPPQQQFQQPPQQQQPIDFLSGLEVGQQPQQTDDELPF